jgi:hypothetical protein
VQLYASQLSSLTRLEARYVSAPLGPAFPVDVFAGFSALQNLRLDFSTADEVHSQDLQRYKSHRGMPLNNVLLSLIRWVSR